MRPIDADALITRLETAQEVTETFFGSVEPKIVKIHKSLTDEMIEQVEKEPGIVRCRECKYYYANAKYCDAWGYIFAHWEWAEEVPEDGFCMYGERKEET